MKPAYLVPFCLLPLACTSATPFATSSGRRGFAIQCGSRALDCYDEARRQCPDDEYVVLGLKSGAEVATLTSAGPDGETKVEHELLVECRRHH
jgi:hypothetical protein